MKIGVPKEYFIDGINENVRKVVDEALDKFRELGAEIVEVPKEYFIDGINENVRKVVDEALDKFRELGAEIVEISLPHTKYAVPT